MVGRASHSKTTPKLHLNKQGKGLYPIWIITGKIHLSRGEHYRIITAKNGKGALRRALAILPCNDPVLILYWSCIRWIITGSLQDHYRSVTGLILSFQTWIWSDIMGNPTSKLKNGANRWILDRFQKDFRFSPRYTSYFDLKGSPQEFEDMTFFRPSTPYP